MQGFKKTVAVNVDQILFCTDPQVSVGIIVDDATPKRATCSLFGNNASIINIG